MKRILTIAALFAVAGLGAAAFRFDRVAEAQTASNAKTIPEVIILGKEAKMGQVTFNHANHNGGKYSIDGTGPIACIECHHTAQPASALLAPLKTIWPADRTTTLTADLFKKDPAAAGVAACRDCHARANTTPKLLPEIPSIKHESSTAIVTLTNQQAFHRNCDGCHFAVSTSNPEMKVPRATSCVTCHKRASYLTPKLSPNPKAACPLKRLFVLSLHQPPTVNVAPRPFPDQRALRSSFYLPPLSSSSSSSVFFVVLPLFHCPLFFQGSCTFSPIGALSARCFSPTTKEEKKK